MIKITVSPDDFRYDIQSLVQVFFSGEKFSFDCDEADKALDVSFSNDGITSKLTLADGRCFETIYDNDADSLERKELKNILKRNVYDTLKKATGITPDWGTLSGIRPTKIVEMLIEEGVSDGVIRQKVSDEYYLSRKKTELSLDIAHRQINILKDVDYENACSVYVGIPFCPSTCLYCSFTSYPIAKYNDRVDDYLTALSKEIKFLGERLKGRKINTLYVGGGTPTSLSEEQLSKLMDIISGSFDVSSLSEFTVEAGRPDSITDEKLRILKSAGTTRISINPQTMNDKTLKAIGRAHDSEMVKAAFKSARSAGFTDINMDVIVGLPGEGERELIYTLNEILKLSPDEVTVHSLALKRASRLNLEDEIKKDVFSKESSSCMDMVYGILKDNGYDPYYLYRQKNMIGNQENTGFVKNGAKGLYNILMMGDYQDVWAAGAGAVSKLLFDERTKGKRIDGAKDVEYYINNIDAIIDKKRTYFDGGNI